MSWNPTLYESSHSFVWEYGRDLVGLLAPQPGERILDVGCGTGQLTSEIAAAGAHVQGIDNSASMIERARGNHPGLGFEVADVCALPYDGQFDAVFSNAVLHWVLNAETAARAIARALKSGGRFVAEFGGRGNVQAIIDAVRCALDGAPLHIPWFYPSIAEYSAILERCGLEVRFATLFDRPTPLEGGLANWLAMFCSGLTPELQRPEFVKRVEELGAPKLLRDRVWTADYRRLRVVAVKD